MHCFRISALLLLFAFSCSPNDDGPDAPKGPVTSPIKGSVITLAECDFTKLDPGGVQVTATDSVSGKTVATVVTDPTGAYRLDNLPAGTYHLAYEKAGFGTYKLFSRKHVVTTPDSIPPVQLVKEKNGVGTIVRVTAGTAGEYLTVGGVVDWRVPCWATRAVVYFDDEPTVDYNNYKLAEEIYMSSVKYVPFDRIGPLGLKPGQTIYYTAYIEQRQSVSYFDPNYGVWIRPNIDFGSKTAVFSFTL